MPTEVIFHGPERSEPRTRVAIHDSPPSATHQRTTVHGGEGQVVEYADALRTRVVIHQSEAAQVQARASHDPLNTRVQIEQRRGGAPGQVAMIEAPAPEDVLSPEAVLMKLSVEHQIAEGQLKATQAIIRDLDRAMRETRLVIEQRQSPQPSAVIDAPGAEQSEPPGPDEEPVVSIETAPPLAGAAAPLGPPPPPPDPLAAVAAPLGAKGPFAAVAAPLGAPDPFAPAAPSEPEASSEAAKPSEPEAPSEEAAEDEPAPPPAPSPRPSSKRKAAKTTKRSRSSRTKTRK